MKTKINKIASALAGLTLVASMMLASSAFAESNSPNTNSRGMMPWRGATSSVVHKNNGIKPGMRPVVVGKVTAVSGNTITVLGRQNEKINEGATTGATTGVAVTYTVNATNSIVNKNNATSTVSSILVGDMIMVQGTVSGTNVIATNIRINMGGENINGDKNDERGNPKNSSSTPPAFVGNGQPIVVGKIVTVNGNTLTVTTVSNLTYTVDATNAKILKGPNTITISGVSVGDTVIVQGAINGSSVTASTIMDKTNTGPANNPGNPNPENKPAGGFFRGIGKFFMSTFGY